MIRDMLHNFAALIERQGFILNGTRSCRLTRSQPPLFFKMAVGRLLNRYWDEGQTPREESWRDDVLTARDSSRAVESGWDFNSRWCADPQDLTSIETTALLPIDLNAMPWDAQRGHFVDCHWVKVAKQHGLTAAALVSRCQGPGRPEQAEAC